jgi:hypothetical protein
LVSNQSYPNHEKSEETKVCLIRIDRHGIIHTEYKEGVTVELIDLQEVEKIIYAYCGNKPFFSLVDLSNKHLHFDAEARRYAATGNITSLIEAQALIFNTLPMRILVNFYLKFDRPQYPVKVFSNADIATNWLINKKSPDARIA